MYLGRPDPTIRVAHSAHKDAPVLTSKRARSPALTGVGRPVSIAGATGGASFLTCSDVAPLKAQYGPSVVTNQC